MRFESSLKLGAAVLLLALPAPAHARQVKIDTGACRAMFGLMSAMHGGAPRDSVAVALDRILDTPAYRTMFRHYNRSWRPNHLPPEVFKRMILSLEYPGEYASGENQRADTMLPRWRAAFDDLPGYERRVRQIEKAGLPHLIDRGIRYAQEWLPRGWNIPDFTLVVLPQGGSPAFSIDDAQGYDFLQLPRDSTGAFDIQWLVGTIAHESNHLGMRGPQLNLANAADSLALKLVSMCIAEGIATEFISGPPAGRVPAIPGVPFHVFTKELDEAWSARVAEDPEMMLHMSDLLDRAIHGSLTQDQLDQEMRDYWFNGAIGRAYVFGSEMFGAIYLASGKDAVFAAIEDPRQLFELYNQALDNKPEVLKQCVRMPDRAVAEALSIGRARKD